MRKINYYVLVRDAGALQLAAAAVVPPRARPREGASSNVLVALYIHSEARFSYDSIHIMAPQLCSPSALRLAVCVHTLLSARWLLFPLATLAVSGSVVVAMQLTGWFAAPVLIVAIANATALGMWPSMQQGSPGSRYRVVWPMLLVLALVLAVAGCATMEPLPLFSVLVVFALAVGCCSCVSAGPTGDIVLWVYAGWGILDIVVGIAVSYGLHWAGRSLLADNSPNAFDSVEGQWEWMWLLTTAVYVASYLGAFFQLWILALLAYGVRGHPDRNGGVGIEEALNVQGPTQDSDDEGRGAQKDSGSCVLFLWTFMALYLGLLTVTFCGFLFHQLWPAGTVFTTSTPISPPCTGCFCRVRPRSLVAVKACKFPCRLTELIFRIRSLRWGRPTHQQRLVFGVWSMAARWVA